MSHSVVRRFVERAWELPTARPLAVLLVVLVTLVPAVRSTMLLPVRTSFRELLPDSRPSVVELRRVSHRLAGISTLIVVAEGRDADSVRRFVDLVSPHIRKLGPEFVAGVDEGSRALGRFFEAHKHLYARQSDLEALRDDVVARYDHEVAKRAGFDLELTDEAPPVIGVEALRARFTRSLEEARGELGRGYYLAERGRLAAIVVRTPFESGDPRAFELERRIRELSAEIAPARWDPTLRVHFTGNLVTSAEEHHAVTTDLAHVGITGVLLISAAVYLYFLRARVLLVLLLTISTACLWSFAVAFLAVGSLNSATGFLVSIIAGNGINFGILLIARYLESRRCDGLAAPQAAAMAMRASAPGTLTAALCATVAYGSLAVTDFRGFRHFGVIGGAGMLLSWLASYTLLPALLVLGEQLLPTPGDEPAWQSRLRSWFGNPFVSLARRHPRALLLAGAVTGALSMAISVRYVVQDPLEYDMSKVRNDASGPSSARVLARRIDASVSRLSRDGRAIIVDRIDQVEPLVRVLRERKEASPSGKEPFDRVVSVFDLLPQNQSEKLSIMEEIRDRLRRAHELGAIPDGDWTKLERELPDELRPIGIRDLPRDVVWPFEEADGTLGRIVYLVPAAGRSLNDLRYLMQWADSFREVELPGGEVIRGSGDPVILADMLDAVRVEAPRAMGLSMLCTALVILAAFRTRRAGWLALGSVVLGMAWLTAALAMLEVRLNFLNFVALPISFGVGADYAVNVMKRSELDRGRDAQRGLTETGGAVVLCSLTTLLGYGALTSSINGAVRSFGLVGVLGEATMLLSAMLILPAVLMVQSSSRSGSHPSDRRRVVASLDAR